MTKACDSCQVAAWAAVRWAAKRLEDTACTCADMPGGKHRKGCSGLYYSRYTLWLAGLGRKPRL